MAVEALDLEAGDHVLDLCCAPGAKLCLIADRLAALDAAAASELRNIGTVTGVDVSKQRAATAKALLRKYPPHGSPNTRIFVADGCTFSLLAPSRIGPHITPQGQLAAVDDDSEHLPSGSHLVPPFHAPKLLRNDPQLQHDQLRYQKVGYSG